MNFFANAFVRYTSLGLLLSMALMAQQPATFETRGLQNGRWWNEQNEGIKIGFLMGLMDGGAGMLTVYSIRHPSVGLELRSIYDQYAGKATVGETLEEIDTLYLDPRNRILPVVDIMLVVKLALAGNSPAAIEIELQHYRRKAIH